MILSISGQVIVFLWTTVCGMVIAFVYDIFRIIRKAVKTGSLVISVQDLLFWLIACIIMFVSIYYSNDGELRGFLFLGAFPGVVLMPCSSAGSSWGPPFIINITVKAVRFLAFILFYPFRLLVKLAVPVRKAAKAAADSLRKARTRRDEASGRRAEADKAAGGQRRRFAEIRRIFAGRIE